MVFFKSILDGIKQPGLKRTCFYLLLIGLIYLVLYILAKIMPDEIWMFRGTANVQFGYLWFFSIFLILGNFNLIAMSLTFGNFVGIVIGQFLGDSIQYLNSFKITEDMTAAERHALTFHCGYSIWIITIFVFLIGSIVITVAKNHKHKL